VVHEPSIGRVIPDLIIADTSAKYPLFARTRLTFLHCHALAMAHSPQGVSIDRMRKELYVSERSATSVLSDLVRRDFIIPASDTHFISQAASLHDLSMAAVEVKMRRWREALNQAQSYLRFADKSLVVLDGNQVKVDSNISEAFKSAGVGLLLQYGRVTVEEVPAPIAAVMSAERIWAFTKLARSSHSA
jgi:hypothetical protein